ncbi:MAG: hypothetical protein EZS28_013750 [Streblomastix strix]|uniref:Ubiquitin-like domain-containing protein n=1 Tax=Streblomastix strix TaxID=222440 RepID=A0A5J4W817_9EUKA|nr:MAG: hypothetical protein EZS28_013750 [Streblomastix strix]
MSEEQKNQAQLIKVTVERITGLTFEFEVDPNEKVIAIAQKIEEKTGVPVNQLRLFLKGRVFNFNETLSEQGIVDGSTLQFSFRGPGG